MSRSPETTGGDDILHAVVDAQTHEAKVRTCFWEGLRHNRVTSRPYSVFFYKSTSVLPGGRHDVTVVNETIELEYDPAIPGYREPDYGTKYRCARQLKTDHYAAAVNIGMPDTFGPTDFKAVHEYILGRFEQETSLGPPTIRGHELPSQVIAFQPEHPQHASRITQHIICATAGHLALDKYL